MTKKQRDEILEEIRWQQNSEAVGGAIAAILVLIMAAGYVFGFRPF